MPTDKVVYPVKSSKSERYLFAVGTLQNDVKECRGAIGGTLTGPRSGDVGDWGYRLLRK